MEDASGRLPKNAFSPFAFRKNVGCQRLTEKRTASFFRLLIAAGFQNKCGLLGLPESILICSSVWRTAYQQGFMPY